MGSVEDLIAFKQIEKYIPEDQRESIASAMGMSIEEINRRFVGKRKEDEFILILLFLDICKNLTGFDEGISKLGTQTYTSDLAIELKDGKKFLLEIKHTDKGKYSISGGNLAKRMDYARSLGLDLYFAISIKGFWMLFPAEYLQTKNGKIDVSDWRHSELDDILGTYGYLFPPKLKIRSVYSKSRDDGVGITHEDYGNLISYELSYDGRRIFRVKGENSPYKGYSMILEALQDRLSTISQDVVKNGDITVVEEYDNGGQAEDGAVQGFNYISEYLFLLAPALHTTHSDDEVKYDTNEIIDAMKSDEYIPHFQKEYIRGMMHTLVDLGVPMCYLKNNQIYRLPGVKELKKELKG
jgi:Holliday junction resolvase